MTSSSQARYTMHLVTSATLLLFQGATVLAAQCYIGICTEGFPASSRDQLYRARQKICSVPGRLQWQGAECAEGGSRLYWPGGWSQQQCWDAFDNIINQCQPYHWDAGNKGGDWWWNGQRYRIEKCSNYCG